MSIRAIRSLAFQYLLIGFMLGLSWFLSNRFTQAISTQFSNAEAGPDMLLVLFCIVLVFALGFMVYELAKPTILPSFVLAIFFGIVGRDILTLLTQNAVSLATLITIGAVLILFEGGLETPFTKFKTLIGPILSLALIGTLINAFLLSGLLLTVSTYFEVQLPLVTAILLGAALASTDPAAIIPSLQGLIFKHPRVKHIAVSESAINDVLGAVLVTIFLGLYAGGWQPGSLWQGYQDLLTTDNLIHITQVVLMGTGVGIVGYLALRTWSNWKGKVVTNDGSDAALFLGVPLFTYTLAALFGGSGYLAVFIASLMFHIRSHFHHVQTYFNYTIEGFMKPMIFILLGALVNPALLWQNWALGLTIGLLFMFVLRPLVVGLTLLPFCFSNQKMTWRELAFLSFVRETGVIPAALLITISLAGVAAADTMMALGLWVILLTLTIQPPLTPLLARKLGLASVTPLMPTRKHHGPVAVLCSRGYSFAERMSTVVQWAQQHHVNNIALLHCPEERYSQSFVDDVKEQATALFKTINAENESNGTGEINFEFLCGPGLLQDNIEDLIAKGDVAIIFVGSKMLDYRLEDVKQLSVPFYFMN